MRWVTRVGRRPPNQSRTETCSGHLNLAQIAGDRTSRRGKRPQSFRPITGIARNEPERSIAAGLVSLSPTKAGFSIYKETRREMIL